MARNKDDQIIMTNRFGEKFERKKEQILILIFICQPLRDYLLLPIQLSTLAYKG